MFFASEIKLLDFLLEDLSFFADLNGCSKFAHFFRVMLDVGKLWLHF